MLRKDDGQNGVHRCVQFVLRVDDVIVKQVDLFKFLMDGFETQSQFARVFSPTGLETPD